VSVAFWSKLFSKTNLAHVIFLTCSNIQWRSAGAQRKAVTSGALCSIVRTTPKRYTVQRLKQTMTDLADGRPGIQDCGAGTHILSSCSRYVNFLALASTARCLGLPLELQNNFVLLKIKNQCNIGNTLFPHNYVVQPETGTQISGSGSSQPKSLGLRLRLTAPAPQPCGYRRHSTRLC